MFNIIKTILQNDMEQLALTPKAIVENNLFFSIPIYQRLFTWNEEQVIPLMQDLLYNFVNLPDSHYHIGLLTSTADNDLVDGQQRFTVMTLLAIVLNGKGNHSEDWHRFLLKDDNNLRLTFRARPEDEKFIVELIHCQDIDNKIQNRLFEGYVNEVMLNAINTILKFINQIDQEAKELTNNGSRNIILTDFSKYLFEHIAFFIQVLPEEYTGRMLNKHFEAMNSTGKNLEEHEILKVDLLRNVSVDEYNRLVTMWNACCDMRRTLFGTSDEAAKKYRMIIHGEDCSLEKILSDKSDSKSIREILSEGANIQDTPNGNKRDISRFYSFLTFPDFLLQVLYIVLKENKTIEISNLQRFFKQENLRDTFKTYWDYINPVFFIEQLYKYRIILDWAVIRIDGDGDYNLLSTDREHSKLEQFEGMLFANSSRYTYYKWIPVILEKVYDKKTLNEDSMLLELKNLDNDDHKFNKDTKLDYENIDRYYFRRLDYYLWESIIDDNYEVINNEENAIFYRAVKQFRFHQYNSIEHLHPQHEDKQIVKWVDENREEDKETINGFGNLALISGSFNSTQSDDSLNPKFGRIRDLIHEGRLESIKLALMYFAADGKSENWTRGRSKEHGEKMIDFLKKTYPNDHLHL